MNYHKGQLPNPTPLDKKDIRKIDEDLFRFLNEQDQNLDSIFSSGFTDGQFLTFTSHVTPDTQFAVAHNLSRTPTGYIPVSKDKAADLYTGTAADSSNLYLKCDVSSATIKIWVF